MKKNIVIIPTYNERDNIESMIQTILSLSSSFNILVVDDGSPDGTPSIVKKCQKKHPHRIFLLERKKKEGLGPAYLAGFDYAINKGYSLFYEIDADFSHNPKHLLTMEDLLEKKEADIIIGSRYYKGIRVKNWSKLRLFISFGASIYVRLLTRMPIKDPTAGYKGYNEEAIQFLLKNKDLICMKGYGFQIMMKYFAWKNNFKLKEIPITFYEREKGKSKMGFPIILEALLGVIKLALKKHHYKGLLKGIDS